MVQRTVRVLIILAAAFLSLALSAKADDIVFSGDQAGSDNVGVAISLSGPDHEFGLANAPLDSLTINGVSVGAFSGDLSITGVEGDTTDSSGDLLFNGGTLTISSGSTDLVTAQLLGSALLPTSVEGVYGFLAVLDPDNTTFGGALSSEGPLVEGLGETVQILLPVTIVDDTAVFAGDEVGAEVGLVTPEPSTIALLGIGLGGLLIMSRRRLGFNGSAAH